MRKIVNPCMVKTGSVSKSNAFAAIEYNDGKLSISGVVGPMANGNCRGSCGQCCDSIRAGEPTKDWTPEMLQKFCDIWDRWHLNDMNPCCEHQRALGWMEQAREPITLYHYTLRDEARKLKKKAEKEAIIALREGKTFTPTADQSFFASLPEWLDIYEAPAEELAPHYEPSKRLFAGDKGPSEQKIRGWVNYEESELGILCKPCPVCGYKYGTAWKTEPVPQDVIDWLEALPDTSITPAWV